MRFDEPAPGLVVAQPERGFKYGAEAFWVAGFALEARRVHEDSVIDIGTGSGVIAALLARQGLSAVGVDVREEWKPLWAETRDRSGLGARLELIHDDIRNYQGGPYPLAVSNPPFFALDAGPTSPDPWKRAARSETAGTLVELIDAALHLVGHDGRFCLVIPVEREAEVRAMPIAVTRAARVGRRRWLAELRHQGTNAPSVVLQEDSPRVLDWYALARA